MGIACVHVLTDADRSHPCLGYLPSLSNYSPEIALWWDCLCRYGAPSVCVAPTPNMPPAQYCTVTAVSAYVNMEPHYSVRTSLEMGSIQSKLDHTFARASLASRR